jgi:hypothetical protein
MPWLDYSKLPWLKQPPRPQNDSGAGLEGLLADLKTDLESAAAGLTALTDSFADAEQNAMVTANVTPPAAANFGTRASRDFSARLSQDLSGQNGQLLSESFAMPTASPRSPWEDWPGEVVVGAPAGVPVLETYPPRTAWGNEGVVVTAPGGAVFALVQAPPQASGFPDARALRDVNRQLQAVRDEIERLQTILANLNTGTNRSPGGAKP